MTINPNSPIDNAAQVDTQKSAQQRNANSASNSSAANTSNSPLNAESPAAEALSAFAMDENEGTGGVDATGADQLTQGLLKTMAGNFNGAVGAHAGLNATSVFQLLQ